MYLMLLKYNKSKNSPNVTDINLTHVIHFIAHLTLLHCIYKFGFEKKKFIYFILDQSYN